MATESQIPKAAYFQLGKSGVRVSVPILGAMGYGDKIYTPWALEEEAFPLLKAAYDCGINAWETSCSYGRGTSEIILGKAIKKYSIPRQTLVIMTKVRNPVRQSNDEKLKESTFKHFEPISDYVNQFGLSRQSIFENVDASLKRLQTEYIDLLQIHRFGPTVPISKRR